MRNINKSLIFIGVFVLLAAGCGKEDTDNGNTPSSADDNAGMPSTAAIRPSGSSVTLDGSSVAAFENSLAVFEAEVSDEDYKRLKSAIQFLLVYDLSARGNKEKLYRNLDGMTPDQVLALAHERWKK